MYRRRRSTRDPIAFSFDSFLDVVANVIGIIVRLILVAWVGARSYTAALEQMAPTPLPAVREIAPPTPTEDPVHSELDPMRLELADARLKLLDRLQALQLADEQSQVSKKELAALEMEHHMLADEAERVGIAMAGKGKQVAQATASAEELRQRAKAVLAKIKALEAQPSQKQELRYHTPVSRAVHADEMFFECRHGRVTFIDLPAFMQEIHAGLEDKVAALKTQWQVSATTTTAGAFRLRYTVEREKSGLEGLGGGPTSGSFRYGLSGWELEPISPDRGEPLATALKETSDFRRLVDRLDPQITVVTFWVYADSFELFRRLRDHLYERGVEVAGRPLTEDAPIAASRFGTASRGQ